MIFAKRMLEIGAELEDMGHAVVLPKFTHEYARMNDAENIHSESLKNKRELDLIRSNFREIKDVDAILVVNENKNGVENYVGGNTFLEMGFAHVLNKKIFLLHPIPDVPYADEMESMSPVILTKGLSAVQ